MKSIELGSSRSRWHYEEKGTGTPVVLVHGFPLDHRIWADQLAALSASNRVIAVDLKGFGKSSSTEAFTIDSMADELAEFMQKVGATPGVLAGLSMGGYIALSLAARHPELLKGLMIVSSKGEADPQPAKEGRQKTAELAQKSGSKAVAEQMMPRIKAGSGGAAAGDHGGLCAHDDRQCVVCHARPGRPDGRPAEAGDAGDGHFG
jgi:pimeloyl-ACP methyl ester carboxylesterase